jgi:sterol desaturase/sphingolipid hydroxylase (fatty acid hydroxylase superfamily)
MIYIYLNLVTSFFIFGYYTYKNDYNNINRIKERNKNELDSVYKKILPNVLLNVFLLSIPAIYYGNILLQDPKYHLFKNLPLLCRYSLLPILVDMMFYSVHKLLHNKYLFYFHKRHHELIHPVGIGSFYMSPVEFYCAIIIPIFGPLVLLGANNYHVHMWLTFTIGNAICVAHGNSKNISEFHDYHHYNFKYNFGIDIFMDYLFRTKKYNIN